MEPILRSAQVLKQEAEKTDYQEKEVAEYVKQHQALDREERVAWRDAQNLYAEEKKRADKIQMWEIQAEAKEKKRADKMQTEKKKRADEIQMAKVVADKKTFHSTDGAERPSSS